MTDGPVLGGVTVLDLSRGLAGAICTLQLADAGARVIVVEAKAKETSPAPQRTDVDQLLLRDKESLAIDFDAPDVTSAIGSLIAQANVVVTDRETALSVEYEELQPSHPQLIVCSLSPYGESGPHADLPATELELQGITGHMAFLGELGQPPVRAGADIAEVAGAMHAFVGIVSALYWRETSGRGQHIHVSRAGALLALGSHWMADFSGPDAFTGGVTHPYELPEVGYRCKDRQVIFGFFGRRSDKRDPFHELCKELGLDDLLKDPFIAEHGAGYIGVGKDAQEMKPLLERAMSSWNSNDFLDMIHRIGGRGAPILEYDELYSDPQHPEVAASKVIFDIAGQDGHSHRAIRSPWCVNDGFGRAEHSAAQARGESTAQVLREAGLSDEQIEDMRTAGWID